jgi:hypothetical protein
MRRRQCVDETDISQMHQRTETEVQLDDCTAATEREVPQQEAENPYH